MWYLKFYNNFVKSLVLTWFRVNNALFKVNNVCQNRVLRLFFVNSDASYGENNASFGLNNVWLYGVNNALFGVNNVLKQCARTGFRVILGL
jgi:hypothetical protein